MYDQIAHWVWGGRLAVKAGAGGAGFRGRGRLFTLSSGISAMAQIMFLGKSNAFPRKGWPPLLPLTLLGTGTFVGSAGTASSRERLGANGTAALAFTTTTVSPGSGRTDLVFAEWIHSGKPSALGFASGIVAGLVAITPQRDTSHQAGRW